MEKHKILKTKAHAKKHVIISIFLILILIIGMKLSWDLRLGYKFRINKDGAVTITEYTGKDTKVVIPSKLLFLDVKEIGFECFRENELIEEVDIPSSVEEIGVFSFLGCPNLKRVSGGENVSIIYTYAFAGDESLSEIFSLENVQILYAGTFASCRNLENVQLSDKLECIGGSAFSGTKIDYTVVPQGTKYVDGSAFSEVEEKSEFIIVGDNALIRYPYEEVVEIPEGIKTIDVYNDSEQMNTKKLMVPNSVQFISIFVLSSSDNAVIYIPENVNEIGYYSGKNFVEDELLDVSKICGIKGSYAEDYAKRYNIPFEEVERWY